MLNIKIRIKNSQYSSVEDFDKEAILVSKDSEDLLEIARQVKARFQNGNPEVPVEKLTATIKIDLT